MSSYQEEYRKGYEEGIEAGRVIAQQMYKDAKHEGYEKGLRDIRIFGDKEKEAYYQLSKLFKYLGIKDQPKLVDKYKTYIMEEAKSFNG